MRKLSLGVASLLLVAFGYVLGSYEVFAPASLWAQAAQGEEGATASDLTGASPETIGKIQAALQALQAAREALEGEGHYVPATQGLNVFAITAGGVDAVQDLESGRGVDPETFAALYAGLATDEVAAKLGRDADQRLTYNNRLIRMYPISRLKKMYSIREAIQLEGAAGSN